MKLIEIVNPDFSRELREFIVEAKKYLGMNCRKEYHHGQWGFEIDRTGRESVQGRETASYRGEPVWGMIYHGRIRSEFLPPILNHNDSVHLVKRAFRFMNLMLLHPDPKRPFRGPEEMQARGIQVPVCFSDLHYVARTSTVEYAKGDKELSEADISHFSGDEFIILDRESHSDTLWECGYNGGFIDS